jgi:hypothetical protein
MQDAKNLHKCAFHFISLFAGLKKQSHEIHEKRKVNTSGHCPKSQRMLFICVSGQQSLSISNWQSLSISSWQRNLQGRQRFLILLLHFAGGQSLPEQQAAGYCRLRQSALRQEKGLQGDYEDSLKK